MNFHIFPTLENKHTKAFIENLIFDPTLHGWNGELADNASLVGDQEPGKVNMSPRRVIISYSYQGIENYAELSQD